MKLIEYIKDKDILAILKSTMHEIETYQQNCDHEHLPKFKEYILKKLDLQIYTNNTIKNKNIL